MRPKRINRIARFRAASRGQFSPGIAAEDALFTAFGWINAHGEEHGFAPGTEAHLNALGRHVEALLPWLRWGEEVRPWEN
jgi:hypothetical protein